LDSVGVDLGHQEMQHILGEVEQIFESQPSSWLPVESVGKLVAFNTGYEDEEELDSTLNMTFATFIKGLPHFTTKIEKGRLMFCMKKEPPQTQWTPKKMVYKINTTQDLWTVFMMSKHCVVRIPELDDFELRPFRNTRVDTIYNHIGHAIFNLGNYVKPGGGCPYNMTIKEKIASTVYGLNLLLDVPKPFTWEVYDPSGISEFKPNKNVQTFPMQRSDID